MPHLRNVLTATLIASFAMATIARADSDIEITAEPSSELRVLPGHSGTFAVVVTNLGPDPAATTLSAGIELLDHGYTLSIAEPACGAFTASIGEYSYYSVALPAIAANQSVTCRFEVARDTSAYGASDFNLLWAASTAGDANPSNDTTFLTLGSLVDVAIDLTPLSFQLDRYGFASGTERLHVINRGPSHVEPFVVGACEDNRFPEFTIEGEFDGGCGSTLYQPPCFDYGFGFEMPDLPPGAELSCDIQLSSIDVYAAPLSFPISATDLMNFDTFGGSLIDTKPSDNGAELTLGPMPDAIFGDGFES